MKKITFVLAVLCLSGSLQAQLFSDDFESYASGSYIGPQSASWTTWSGAGGEGTAEDVTVTTNQANSGSKSVYFSSTSANGGPQDVVLDFGPVYNSGLFTFEAAFYINAGKNAYFNFQGAAAIGTLWALNVNMDGGQVIVDDGLTPNLAVGSYSDATWFTLRIEANMTLNVWKAYVDGVQFGQWENGVNALASLDLFPIQNSQFFVDDVMFDHQPVTLANLNAMASSLVMGGNIATQVVDPVVTVKNAGTTAINSFDVVLDYNGNQYTQNITGQNLASLQSFDVTFTGINLVAGSNVATATVSNVNGASDDDPNDDVITQTVNPVVPAPGKIVVGEEATGTWCQWCPRGAVFMDLFETEYADFWAGIAVHNADPMVDPTYDTGVGALIGGYPSALVDRGPDVDPSQMAPDFFERLQIAPKAFITNGATWDASTRTLNVSISAEFQAAATSSYKLACVLTEDGVTGTGAGWNQSNAYAGGGNGVMGGYEALPNPVPAAQMVYDHVARKIAPSFGGYANSFPATVNAGATHTVNFSFVLPAGWDENEMHIIGLLIAPNGTIDNAGKATIAEAVANGFENGTSAGLFDMDTDQIDATFKLYPNPANDYAVVVIDLDVATQVEMTLSDVSGKVIAFRDYGSMNGAQEVVLNTSSLAAGVYVVELSLNGVKITKRLIIE
ncbi:MAG: Omp28-related outer membrane protein [Bacteroidota bacterium]|jgi:hypothetical protein